MEAALEFGTQVAERPSEPGDLGSAVRVAQAAWAQQPISSRLAVLRRARHAMAEMTEAFCAAISPALARTPADTRGAEVLPLLDACRFLERRAAKILAPRKLGRSGLPLWLSGVASEIHRAPFGQVLVIAPGNYPLFLAGAQTLQALAAGNAVVWKPGSGGRAVAQVFASAMYAAGLPRELLEITDETVEAARDALAGRTNGVAPDKVIFTGSAATGREVLRELARTLTPCVVELSGCDAVIVLPSADAQRVAKAIAFGMRLNGSATCIAPRRLILVSASPGRRAEVLAHLRAALDECPAVRPAPAVARQLDALLQDATRRGAEADWKRGDKKRPILVTNVTSDMELAQADIFAPVLMVMQAETTGEALAIVDACPYALAVSIFGNEPEASAIASAVTAGSVLLNDLIVPTVDPRVPFGGRRHSGFGATRGAEGLLEMTAAKTIAVRRGGTTLLYEPTGEAHEELFDGAILAAHGGTWGQRLRGLKRMVAGARRLK